MGPTQGWGVPSAKPGGAGRLRTPASAAPSSPHLALSPRQGKVTSPGARPLPGWARPPGVPPAPGPFPPHPTCTHPSCRTPPRGAPRTPLPYRHLPSFTLFLSKYQPGSTQPVPVSLHLLDSVWPQGHRSRTFSVRSRASPPSGQSRSLPHTRRLPHPAVKAQATAGRLSSRPVS